MIIDISRFITEKHAHLQCSVQGRGVIETYQSRTRTAKRFREEFDKYLSCSILSGDFGDLMAVTFRRWIDEQYTIGSEEGTYDPITRTVVPDDELLEAA